MESQMKRLKDEADIKMVVESLGIPIERKGMNYFVRCPSPDHDDSSPSAYFKDGWNNIYCNACGRSFKAIDIIMYTNGCDVKAAADYLWELEGRPDWFVSGSKEESTFCLSPKEAHMIGIRQSGEASCFVALDDIKKTLPHTERYCPSEIDGYLRFRNARVSWRDFMSEQEFVSLVIRKAAEAAEIYRMNGLTAEAGKAAAILHKAALSRGKMKRLPA